MSGYNPAHETRFVNIKLLCSVTDTRMIVWNSNVGFPKSVSWNMIWYIEMEKWKTWETCDVGNVQVHRTYTYIPMYTNDFDEQTYHHSALNFRIFFCYSTYHNNVVCSTESDDSLTLSSIRILQSKQHEHRSAQWFRPNSGAQHTRYTRNILHTRHTSIEEKKNGTFWMQIKICRNSARIKSNFLNA